MYRANLIAFVSKTPQYQHPDRLLQQCIRPSSESVSNDSLVHWLVLPQYPRLFVTSSSRTGALNEKFVRNCKESVGVGRGGCGWFQTRAEEWNRGIEATVFLAMVQQ